MIAVFDDTGEDLTTHADGWSRSTNHGASFTDQGPLPDARRGNVSDTYGSPCIGYDPASGTLYVAALGSIDQRTGAIAFYVSTDRGAHFNPALNAADPNLAPDDVIDFPSMAVDPGQGLGGGHVYLAYADFVQGGESAVRLRLSTLVGRSFAVTEVVNPPLGSHGEASLPSVAVAPTHRVYVAFYSQMAGVPSVAVVASSDTGNHFGSAVRIAALHISLGEGVRSGNLGLRGEGPDGTPAPLDAYPSPVLAINPVSGALYVAYVDAAAGDRASVFFTQSNDEGQSWAAPVRVNDDATNADQFLPAMAVTPDGARLAIAFYDRRDDPDGRLINRYAVMATISDSTVQFGANRRLSPRGFRPRVGMDRRLRPAYFSSHTSMTADATSFFDAYTDTIDGCPEIVLMRWGVHADETVEDSGLGPVSVVTSPRPPPATAPAAAAPWAVRPERRRVRLNPKPSYGSEFQGDAGMCGTAVCSGSQVCCVIPLADDAGTPQPNSRCDDNCTSVCMEACPSKPTASRVDALRPHGGGVASAFRSPSP